ncbi:MAG: DNA polymerase III subunit epsilon [Hyphomicrobiales bacterium]
MLRELVLDTETTGFKPEEGHRIVEIGAVELINHVPTGNVYHQYINPERDMPIEAFNVHGLSEQFLRGHPVFADIADAFLEFISDGVLVIHNAAFDMAFINAELSYLKVSPVPDEQVLDTLAIARRKHPMGPNSLDALCRRYGVDNSGRTKHGALLDSELLADVYVELIGGRQHGLEIDPVSQIETKTEAVRRTATHGQRPVPLKSRLTDDEKNAHNEFVDSLSGEALWQRYSN